MATTSFTDGVTLSAASWFNDADTVVYAGLTTIAGTNTITATGPASMTAYAANQAFKLIPAATNTGAATLNLTCNSVALGAKSIFNRGVALTGGEIISGQPVLVMYDGTRFNIIGSASTPIPRSYLSGLGMSTAGSSATMTVAAGQAADSTNSAMMTLASAISKTTSAWAVGTGNGGIDTGAIANATWYHFYEIMRPDTGVVDVLFSLSASAPTMPANYTLKRRIGSGLTNGSAQWVSFVQDGDFFQWAAVVGDVSAANPGTSAVTRVLSVPLGVRVRAVVHANVSVSTTADFYMGLLSDLSTTDEAVTTTNANFGVALQAAGATDQGVQLQVMTDTSQSIRSRLRASVASTTLLIGTRGWFDMRGRDS